MAHKPIFNIGDIICQSDKPEFTYTIREIKDGYYICDTCEFSIDNKTLQLVTWTDERIRKYLSSFVELNSGVNLPPEDAKKILGWIDKQGERKPTDKVEPKFKVGDKIRKKSPRSFDKDMQVARIKKDYYICNHIGKFSSEMVPLSEQSSYELIEHNPAWSKDVERKLNRLYSIIGQAADTHAFSTTCRLIGDKEAIELQEFLKDIKN